MLPKTGIVLPFKERSEKSRQSSQASVGKTDLWIALKRDPDKKRKGAERWCGAASGPRVPLPSIPTNIIRLALVSAWAVVEKQLTKAGDVTDTSHFIRTFNRSVGARGKP